MVLWHLQTFILLCRLSVGSFLIQTFFLFSGPVRHLHPLTPSSSPITCPTDLFSTYYTRALVSSLCKLLNWKSPAALEFAGLQFSLLSPSPVISSGGRPKPSGEVCAGHRQRHGFPPHLGTDGFTALPQQQACHGKGVFFSIFDHRHWGMSN